MKETFKIFVYGPKLNEQIGMTGMSGIPYLCNTYITCCDTYHRKK